MAGRNHVRTRTQFPAEPGSRRDVRRVLFRPDGAHPAWGATAGFVLQLAGLVLYTVSLWALGRSFGFVAADRGLKTRGPYAVVRHPVYASTC